MKHYILHGDNHVKSRRALTSLVAQMQNRGFEIIKIDGATTTKSALLTAARSQTLISLDQLVVVENLLSTNRKAREILIELAKSHTTFVFWEKKPIPATTLKNLPPSFFTREFKIPTLVFKFLDSVYPKNTKHVLKMLQDSQKTAPPEFLLLMLARQVRLLIWAKCNPDTLKMASWQKAKLTAQAGKFTLDELLNLQRELLELDRAQKHSQLPEDLPSSLALLVASL